MSWMVEIGDLLSEPCCEDSRRAAGASWLSSGYTKRHVVESHAI